MSGATGLLLSFARYPEVNMLRRSASAFLFCVIALNGAVPDYSKDIAPILFRHCTDCHHANDIAPMPLMPYAQTKPWAAAIKEAIAMRKMPPWKADPHFGKWSNDPVSQSLK
jgi:hypothetical protein